MTVGQILNEIEGWAPGPVAQSYDNVGLLVGDRLQAVTKVLTALDLVPAVVEEAIDGGFDLIITHHPTIFNPLKKITEDSLEGAMIARLIRAGISLIAAHTNLDAVKGGVSFALAEKIGLKHIEFLAPMGGQAMKLVTFVPPEALDAVREALAASGAGVIGNYDTCGFGVAGTGNFRPLDGANPYAGDVTGSVHEEKEVRYEVQIPEWNVQQAIAALKNAHPYEEVAFDLYSVRQDLTDFGMGAIGALETAIPLKDFLRQVATSLNTSTLRYVGHEDTLVQRIAVCGGSGSSLIGTAMSKEADVFVTGDVTYHRFFEVLSADGSARMGLIDAGHYETEFMTEALLQKFVSSRFSRVTVAATQVRTSPVKDYLI